jgi:hypothetical protein
MIKNIAKESEMSYRRPNLGNPRCLHFMYPSLLIFGVSIVRCTTLWTNLEAGRPCLGKNRYQWSNPGTLEIVKNLFHFFQYRKYSGKGPPLEHSFEWNCSLGSTCWSKKIESSLSYVIVRWLIHNIYYVRFQDAQKVDFVIGFWAPLCVLHQFRNYGLGGSGQY